MSRRKLATNLIGRTWTYSDDPLHYADHRAHLAGQTAEIVAAWIDKEGDVAVLLRFDDDAGEPLAGTTQHDWVPTRANPANPVIGPAPKPTPQEVVIVGVEMLSGEQALPVYESPLPSMNL